MRLGMLLKYSGTEGGPNMDVVLEAERLGFDSVWAGESWGVDTVTPLTWVLARTTKIKAGAGIMQMSARTPACAHENLDVAKTYGAGGRSNEATLHDAVTVVFPVSENPNWPAWVNHAKLPRENGGRIIWCNASLASAN